MHFKDKFKNETNFFDAGICKISAHISNRLFCASLTPSAFVDSIIFFVITRFRCVTTN